MRRVCEKHPVKGHAHRLVALRRRGRDADEFLAGRGLLGTDDLGSEAAPAERHVGNRREETAPAEDDARPAVRGALGRADCEQDRRGDELEGEGV